MSSGGAIGISRKRVPIAAKIALPTVGARPTMPVSPAPAEGRSLRSISTTSIGGVSLNRGTRYCAKMRIQNTAVGKQDRFEERTTDHLFEDNNARLATKLFDLLTVLCNVPSFIDSQPTKRQVCSTDAVRQRIRLPIRIPAELWLCPTEFLDAFCPKDRRDASQPSPELAPHSDDAGPLHF
jgi:hypothetical protein